RDTSCHIFRRSSPAVPPARFDYKSFYSIITKGFFGIKIFQEYEGAFDRHQSLLSYADRGLCLTRLSDAAPPCHYPQSYGGKRQYEGENRDGVMRRLIPDKRQPFPEGFAMLTFWVAGLGFVLWLGSFLSVAWWPG